MGQAPRRGTRRREIRRAERHYVGLCLLGCDEAPDAPELPAAPQGHRMSQLAVFLEPSQEEQRLHPGVQILACFLVHKLRGFSVARQPGIAIFLFRKFI